MNRRIKNGKRNVAVISAIALAAAGMLSGCASSSGEASSDSSDESIASGDSSDETLASSLDTSAIDLERTGDYSDNDLDDSWDESQSTMITLSDSQIEIDGSGAEADGSVLTITAEGTYVLTGTLSDGQVIVSVSDDENVHIVLNGVDISALDDAAIYVENAKNVYMTLEEGTENNISDGSTRDGSTAEENDAESASSEETSDEESADDASGETDDASDADETESSDVDDSDVDETESSDDDETDASGEYTAADRSAAIFARDDLIINGSGTLNVTGNYKDAIACRDDLELISGTINITAEDDGVVGRDSVSVMEAVLNIESKDDGIKSTKDTDAEEGWVVIDGGEINISAGDDGIHSETLLAINGGTLTISESYEGLESLNIVIRDGVVDVNSEDDGLNVTDGSGASDNFDAGSFGGGFGGGRKNLNSDSDTDSGTEAEMSSDMELPERGEMPDMDESAGDREMPEMGENAEGGEMPEMDDAPNMEDAAQADGESGTDENTDSKDNTGKGFGGNRGGGGGGGMNENPVDGTLLITGGSITVNANGDGLDSNGYVEITGGTVTVYGPSNSGNGVIDYAEQGSFTMDGGTLIAMGISGMNQAPSDGDQSYVVFTTDSNIASGEEVSITDSDGNVVASFKVGDKDANYFVISNESISEGETYTLTSGSITAEGTAGESPDGGMGMGKQK